MADTSNLDWSQVIANGSIQVGPAISDADLEWETLEVAIESADEEEQEAMARAKKPVDKDKLLKVGNEIVERLGPLEEAVFEMDGALTLPVKRADGSFANKGMRAGREFTLKECYIGTRDGLIFVFEPVEGGNAFDTVDVNLQKMDDAFPLFGPLVAKVFDLGENVEKAPEAVHRAMARVDEVVEQEAKEAFEHVATLPDFGRF